MTLKYSVVSPVYNVEAYLDKMISSIVEQTLSFENNIELILVNDESKDKSKEICLNWQKKYPNNIKYLEQKNSGVSATRNKGFTEVTTPWCIFIDSDDFIKNDFFEQIDNALNNYSDIDLVITNCYRAKVLKNNTIKSKPIDFIKKQTKNHVHVEVFDEKSRFVQFHINVVFKSNIIRSNNLLFKNIKPMFEDAFFINTYLYYSNKNSLIIPQAIYYYRKRSKNNSTIDLIWNKKERYTSLLEDGYISLINFYKEKLGYIPNWIQHVIILDVYNLLSKVLKKTKIRKLIKSLKVQEQMQQLLYEIFKEITVENILRNELTSPIFKILVCKVFKHTVVENKEINCVIKSKLFMSTLKFTYISLHEKVDITILKNNKSVKVFKYSKIKVKFYDKLIYQHNFIIILLKSEARNNQLKAILTSEDKKEVTLNILK